MNSAVNNHLNIFRYFHESQDVQFIENNLSRAFAICLQQDLLFFSEYLREVVSKDDYYYLFSHYETNSRYSVDLQLDTNAIELSGVRKVYAIAMTGDEHLSMVDFLELKADGKKDSNITDIWILIKDMVFVIEVKRTNEDCKQQLSNQIYPIVSSNPNVVVEPINFSWPHTLRIMERIVNIRQMREDTSCFITDFLSLCERRYPEWFPTKPFYQLPPLAAHTSKTIHAREKRLRQIIQQSGEQILSYNDRMAISCKFPWASEIIPFFKTHQKVDYVTFMIWPGNTKGQGYSLYNKPLDWVNKSAMQVGKHMFEINTEYHLKFCHFNRYITSIDFNDEDLVKPINTKDNFYHKSGKWDLDRWPTFEKFMDSHFKLEFDWRETSKWQKHFLDTDRSYFTVSFGFATELWVPYIHFQEIDKLPGDFSVPAQFIRDIVLGYHHLLD